MRFPQSVKHGIVRQQSALVVPVRVTREIERFFLSRKRFKKVAVVYSAVFQRRMKQIFVMGAGDLSAVGIGHIVGIESVFVGRDGKQELHAV